MLEGIRGILSAEFDNVIMVADRRSLKRAVNKLSPDIVVVELSLPEPDGVNIVRILKIDHPDLKIVVLSFYDEVDTVKAVLDAGAIGFVLKRTAGEDLLPAVKSAHKGQPFVSPSIELETI
jgi:DNA-binding NarL/FixJ family response regulator